MIMDINSVNYSIHFLTQFDEKKPTLLCLHGFTGTSHTFSCLENLSLNHNIIAIDLIGHGLTSVFVHPYRYTAKSQVADLDKIITNLKLESVDLLGYSMGGRLALLYATMYPNKVNRLILESSSPGLAEDQARKKRRQSDNRLACLLLDSGIHNFVDYWESVPLFSTQKTMPKHLQEKVRQERLSQHPIGLAMSLRYFGTGSQPSLWDKLTADYPFETYFLAGSYDEKFVSLAYQMAEFMTKSNVTIINKSGHCIHLEKPNEFIKVIEDVLM